MLFSQPVISHLCSDTALGYLGRLKIPTLLLFPKALQTLTPTYCRNLISVYVLAHNLGSVSNLSLAKPSVPSGTGLAPIWWNSLPYEIHEIQPADAFTALLTNVLNLAAPRFAFLSVSRTVSCSCYYATGEGVCGTRLRMEHEKPSGFNSLTQKQPHTRVPTSPKCLFSFPLVCHKITGS